MKRTFIGIKIENDPSITRLLNDLKKGLPYPELHWIDPDNLHLTLRFLGNTEETQLDFIIRELDNLVPLFQIFDLEIKGIGFFGSASFPRILWAGIIMPEEIFRMVDNIENIVCSAGFERERKAYSPHLTFCRIKNFKDSGSFYQMKEKYKNSFINKQEIRQIILYESLLKSSGSEYIPLKKFLLRNRD